MDSQMTDERGRIPDLMKIGALPSDLLQDTDTEVLDPVVNTDDFARFVLSNKGFLHSFSKITLSVDNAGEGQFPVNIGVHSLVKRCALRIGTTVVAEIDDFNHWMGYKSMFIDNDINLERETYLSSRQIALKLDYNNTVGALSNINASSLSLKTRLYPAVDAAGTAGTTGSLPELRTGNKPVFSISVADLFPFLRFNQLPLYMIDQQVSIELHFQPASSLKRCVHVKTVEATGTLFTIDKTQTKFIADYIYYDGDMMESYRNQNQMMNWTYNDYRLNKRSFTHTQLALNNVMDIGGAGRLVNKIVCGLEKVVAAPDTSMINSYESVAPGLNGNNNGLFTTNLVYNDNRLYPIDRTNSAIHFHDLVQAEQNIPQISRQMFNKEGGSLSDAFEYMNYAPSSSTEGLNGRFHYIAYRLNRNERVNSRGVQLELKYTDMLAGTYTHRTWLELVKTATLSNGKFATEFA